MLQHVLLTMVAPPLLWIGAPALPLLRGLPAGVAKRGLGPFLAWPPLLAAARALVHPLVGWLALALATLLWHLPGPYQLALLDPGWHQFEHACFLVAGLLFWFPVIQPYPSRPHWPRWAMVPYLLLADVVNTLLAAVFVFAERPSVRGLRRRPAPHRPRRARRSGGGGRAHVGRGIGRLPDRGGGDRPRMAERPRRWSPCGAAAADAHPDAARLRSPAPAGRRRGAAVARACAAPCRW